MKNVNRFQDGMEIAVGVWLCVSPWVLGYSDPLEAAGWSAIGVGATVLLFSLEDLVLPSEIEEWFDLTLGVGLMASPWLWSYSDNVAATLNSVVSGFLVSGLAFWALEHLGFPGIGSEPHRPQHS